MQELLDQARSAPAVDLGVLVDGAEAPAFVPDAILPISGPGGGSVPPGLSDSCEPNSFVPGTRVLMADGSTKPIEEVREGEEVLATDPVTGETTSRRVVATITGEGQKDLVEITVDTDGPAGDETGVLVATDGHPFWVPEQHRWVKAGELVAGDQLQGPDGTQLQVVSTKTWTALQKVYNLTIDDTHTYHVLAADTPVLVHNSGGCLPALRDWRSQGFQFGNETFLLDKKGMEHILARHHPEYWDGSVKAAQSFFDSGMSIDDVQGAIGEVMRQNRDALLRRGSRGMYQIRGNVNGVDYVLGMNRGRVGQFYPESP
ncbi:polymorphic toxin-type HINT domain-containing protein [Saccharopolyspora shandongensis]|uniref:polymorphic toxin-type HINT domain-containing protein n=1 Tax=Saccharopolyspora shandongensis TaxID=418495 RepID=UPI0033EA54FF